MIIDDIKSRLNLLDLASASLELRAETGGRFRAKCPFHPDKTASLKIFPSRGNYHCFGCGAHGDALDFYAGVKGITIQEAITQLRDSIPELQKVELPPPPKAAEAMEFLCPAPRVPSSMHHKTHGNPSAVYTYKTQAGELGFFSCRFDTPNGKEVLPFTCWKKANGAITWRWAGPAGIRPLRGTEKLDPALKRTVLVVEGEKTQDAAGLLFPDLDIITWMGGTKSMAKTDWSPLAGRRVVIWPDADAVGVEAAQEIALILADVAKVVKAVQPPAICKGWDLADFQGTPEEAQQYARENMRTPDALEAPVFEPDPEPVPEPPRPTENETGRAPADVAPGDGMQPQAAEVFHDTEWTPTGEGVYKALGYENKDSKIRYWFFSASTQTLLAYTTGQLSHEDIIREIAPANFWESQYGTNRNGKMKTAHIAERLRAECRNAGYFASEKVRGRGAWMDEGRFIIHAGDAIIFNGARIPLSDFKTSYAYQYRESLGVTLPEPATSKEASGLIALMERFAWDRKIAPTLLAGWCVIAPWAGMLDWRPHIWLIGGAGTGKSWILQNVVRPTLGRFQFSVQSKTTEPAIRQGLEGDSLPVVFDEFESENQTERDRVQSILDLARSASSNDGGAIAKGSTQGKGVSFHVRSPFCFASIALNLTQQSDMSRITVLALGSSTAQEKEDNKAEVIRFFSNGFSERLQARAIRHMPTLLANIRTFSIAAGRVLGDTRAGIQVGSMLAGAYLLRRTDAITEADAEAWVRKQDWSEEKPRNDARDEHRLLQRILEKPLRMEGEKASFERTVGELMYIAAGAADEKVGCLAAQIKLAHVGINADWDGACISVTSTILRKEILNGSPWETSYPRILLRLEGAEMREDVKFSAGIISRAVFIPIKLYKQP